MSLVSSLTRIDPAAPANKPGVDMGTAKIDPNAYNKPLVYTPTTGGTAMDTGAGRSAAMPGKKNNWWVWALVILLIAGGAFGIWYYHKKIKK